MSDAKAPDGPPDPPERTPGLLDDWIEVMPDAMRTLSGRVQMYGLWIVVVTAIWLAMRLTQDKPESSPTTPVEAPDAAPP